MKYLAAFFLAVLTTVSAYTASGQNDRGGTASSVEPEGFLRPKSTPAPANAPAAKTAGPKKPLTANLAKDNKSKDNLTTFASSDPKIYLLWQSDTGAKGDKVRIVWYAEDTGGAVSKNKKLTEATQTIPGPGSFGSSYMEMPAGGFPAGKYRVDVYDGTKLAKSIKFTVKK